MKSPHLSSDFSIPVFFMLLGNPRSVLGKYHCNTRRKAAQCDRKVLLLINLLLLLYI